MEVNTGLSKSAREALRSALFKLLADNYTVYLQTQKFHWNVVSKDFPGLHKMFEEQYQYFEVTVDELAERIRALGFQVQATFSAFQKNTSIPQEPEKVSDKDMLKILVKSHEAISRNARKVASLAEKESDHATVDMLGKQLRESEKFAWMLRSSL